MKNQKPAMEGRNFVNIRVYGLCIKENNVLLSDELFKGIKMTKFLGGGLQHGEGTLDCLRREAMEEINREIIIKRHFYTTDFYQPAMFFENTQLVSIYYTIDIVEIPNYPVSDIPLIVNEANPRALRWVPLSKLDENHLTFPIDKRVASMLRAASLETLTFTSSFIDEK